MTFYLFCHLGFGLPFIESAAELARRHACTLVVVLSARQLDRGARGWRHSARVAWKRVRLGRRHRIRVLAVEDVNAPEFLARLATPAHGVIAGFDQILRRDALARFATLVNFHPSLLPYYRGPTPSYWSLQRGETCSGYTLHRVTERVDQGEILFQEAVAIGAAHTPVELDRAIAARAVPCCSRWIEHVARGSPWTVARVDPLAFYRAPVEYLSFPP